MLQSRAVRVAHIAITFAALLIAVVAALDGSWSTAIGSTAACLSLVLSLWAYRSMRRQVQGSVGDLVVTFRPPHSRTAGYAGIAAGLLVTVALLAIMTVGGGWAMSPLLLLGLFCVFQGMVATATRVEVAPDSLKVVDFSRPRGLSLAWEYIDTMRVDPPGGSRLVRLQLQDRSEVSLPALRDADRNALLAAYRECRETRSA